MDFPSSFNIKGTGLVFVYGFSKKDQRWNGSVQNISYGAKDSWCGLSFPSGQLAFVIGWLISVYLMKERERWDVLDNIPG